MSGGWWPTRGEARPLRALRRLFELSQVQVHQEDAAQEHKEDDAQVDAAALDVNACLARGVTSLQPVLRRMAEIKGGVAYNKHRSVLSSMS